MPTENLKQRAHDRTRLTVFKLNVQRLRKAWHFSSNAENVETLNDHLNTTTLCQALPATDVTLVDVVSTLDNKTVVSVEGWLDSTELKDCTPAPDSTPSTKTAGSTVDESEQNKAAVAIQTQVGEARTVWRTHIPAPPTA